MIIYVHEGGSDRVELAEVLNKEGVIYQESQGETVRELGTTKLSAGENPGQPAGGDPGACGIYPG